MWIYDCSTSCVFHVWGYSYLCMFVCVCLGEFRVMHVCVCVCVYKQEFKKKEQKCRRKEEYSGLMGVFRCSVMEQISTGPCMPACVVYSHTLLETHDTPQSWGSVNLWKQQGKRKRWMRRQTGKHEVGMPSHKRRASVFWDEQSLFPQPPSHQPWRC